MLAPYRVLDLTNEIGLNAGKILADLGADVIQVEPPGGSPARRVPPLFSGREEPCSTTWLAYAANKRGLALDFEHSAGRNLLLRLAERADFFIESEAPGRLDQLGLSFEALSAINPRLIYVSISPFGRVGPKEQWPATELTLWAAGGPLLGTKDGDLPPLRISAPQAYRHAGADAATGALVALFARHNDGLGQHVDISVQQSVMQATLSRSLAFAVGDGDSLGGTAAPGRFPARWKTADGYVDIPIGVGTATGPFGVRLFQWLADEGAITAEQAAFWSKPHPPPPGGPTAGEVADLTSRLSAFIATRTKTEMMQAAVDRKLLVSPVFGIDELAVSPHLAARKFWSESNGEPAPPAYPVVIEGQRLPLRRRAPRIGEHTDDILGAELGISHAELVELRAEGVIL